MYNKKIIKLILIIFVGDKLNKISFDYILTYRLRINYKLKMISE